MKKGKKFIALFLTLALLCLCSLVVLAGSTQIYTNPPIQYNGATAQGSIYGYKIDTNPGFIRIAAGTTYVSGGSGLGYTTASVSLYGKGVKSGSANGTLPNGISAQTGQQVYESTDSITSISTSHSVVVANGNFPSIPGLGLRLSDIP